MPTPIELQSAVDPQGAAAAEIAAIWWIMLVGAVLIFLVVMGLVIYGLTARHPRAAVSGRALIVIGGLVFPGIVLSALLVHTVSVGARLGADPAPDAIEIDVTGHMWWWDVRYRDGAGGHGLVTANELRIPVGRPVRLHLRANDVIHSFWVPNLAGKIDMIPGRTNVLVVEARAPGTYRGQCAEFCGLQHTRMGLHVVAEERGQWQDWYARRSRPSAAKARTLEAPAVASPTLPSPVASDPGRALFVEVGCGSCHALAGVSDPPPGIAPDLTGIGSRPSLGAGVLPNGVGNLAAWIAGSQSIKPGNRMPSFHTLTGAQLAELAAYLHAQR